MKRLLTGIVLGLIALAGQAQVQPHQVGSGQITQVSGNAGVLATVNGPLTSTHCVTIDAFGNLTDAGAACGSGGSGLPAGFTANSSTGILTVPSGYATSGTTETVVNLTQGTAATTPPVNTIQVGAPTSVPSSYKAYYPSAPPTDNAGDVIVYPQGGGTGLYRSPVWQVIQRQQLSSATSTVTFSAIPQTYTNLVLILSGTGSTGNSGKWAKLNINGDSTAGDYFFTFLSMSFSGGFTNGGNFSNAGAYAGIDAATITFYNYTSTSGVHVDSVGTAGGSIIGLAYTANIWAGAAPVTSFTVATDDGSTLTPGSTFTLYGVQ